MIRKTLTFVLLIAAGPGNRSHIVEQKDTANKNLHYQHSKDVPKHTPNPFNPNGSP
jgi:hypothetical protein